MAFIKRNWLARIGTGLNKFIIGAVDGQGKQTLTNSPDSITQQGDVISADNLNNLEDRIEAGFNEKQDTLTFDNVPTSGSSNPVKSGGIYTALAGKQDTLTFDNVPTSGSSNPVTSGGVYNAEATKVPTSRTVNGKALSSDITLTASDVGAVAVDDTGWVELYNDHASYPMIVRYRKLNGYVTVIGTDVYFSMSADHALPQNCRPADSMIFFVPISSSTSSIITSGYRLVEVKTDGRLYISTGSYTNTVSFTITFPAG